jgi:hypothetical protein
VLELRQPSPQIPAPGKTKTLLGEMTFYRDIKKLMRRFWMWIVVQKQNHAVIFSPFSLQEIALKIVQEISPPVPQPIFHLHGGKDFL